MQWQGCGWNLSRVIQVVFSGESANRVVLSDNRVLHLVAEPLHPLALNRLVAADYPLDWMLWQRVLDHL